MKFIVPIPNDGSWVLIAHRDFSGCGLTTLHHREWVVIPSLDGSHILLLGILSIIRYRLIEEIILNMCNHNKYWVAISIKTTWE